MALLVLAPLASGVLVGYALGGRLRWLADAKIRALWLLWLATGLQFVHFRYAGLRLDIESWLGVTLMVPIFGLVAVWCLANLPHRPRAVQVALLVILLGGVMNAAVIAANGRMPYSGWAVQAPDQSAAHRAKAKKSPKHVAIDANTKLGRLGDVIPVRPIHQVVSAGDLVLLFGGAVLVATAMRGHKVAGPRSDTATTRPHRSAAGSLE